VISFVQIATDFGDGSGGGTMPAWGAILEGLTKAGAAATKGLPEVIGSALTPAAEEAAAKAAPMAFLKPKAMPSPVGELYPNVPLEGVPEVAKAVRTTGVKVNTLEDMVNQVKDGLFSFVEADPGLSRVRKDLPRKFIDIRHGQNMAEELAAKTLLDVHEPIMNDPVRIARTFGYSITADEVAQAASQGNTMIHGIPVDKWLQHLDALKVKMQEDPISAGVVKDRQVMWDAIHEDMVQSGAILPERFKDAYTPMRHISSVVRGLAEVTGDNTLVNELGQAQKRARGVRGPRESNLPQVEFKVISQYYKWKAMKQSFTEIMADPAINHTARYQNGDVPEHGWVRYNPGRGMPGYEPKEPDAEILDGLVKTLYEKRKTVGLSPTETAQLTAARQTQASLVAGSYVIPEKLAEAFGNLAKSIPSQASSGAYRAGAMAARWLTVYNPRNTFLNLMSDLPTAMLGLPGEKAHPLGVLRFYVTGLDAGMRNAFGGKSRIIEINGQKIDISALLREEAVGGTTHMSQIVGGEGVHPDLTGLVPGAASSQNPLRILGDFMKNARQGVEMAPRIAAGLDALKATGSTHEFGRVARASSLEYGAGAPLAAKQPVLRFISPFLQFAGLAMNRVIELTTTPGSRARGITTVAALPMLIMMWNRRNEAFRKVDDSIPEFERLGSPYIILPSDEDPNVPRVDVTNKPVAWRFRLSVPEQAMQMVGLGNLAPRIGRVVRGQDKPMSFVKETAQSGAEAIAGQMTIPGLMTDVLRGQDRFGNDLSNGQKIQRMMPVMKVFTEGAAATKEFGATAGATRAAEELLGFSAANADRHGRDATQLALYYAVKDAVGKVRSAKTPAQREDKKKAVQAAVKELQDYMKRKNDTNNFGGGTEKLGPAPTKGKWFTITQAAKITTDQYAQLNSLTPGITSQLHEELLRDEGLRLSPYKDSRGNWTIGVGHLLADGESKKPITQEEAVALLHQDVAEAEQRLTQYIEPTVLASLGDVRQRALVNLSFNLGNNLGQFPGFLGAVNAQQWSTAAHLLGQSDYAKQVGDRAERIQQMLKTGEE
jgi:lysozyme